MNYIGKLVRRGFLKGFPLDREILKGFAKCLRHLVMGILRSAQNGELVGLGNTLVAIRAIQTYPQKVSHYLRILDRKFRMLVSLVHGV